MCIRDSFETARGAKFDPEYLCTGSTCTANILQFKITVRVLVNRVRTSLTAYTCPPKDGANLAKKVAVSKSATLTKFEPTFLELEKNLVHKNFILSSAPRPLQHVRKKLKSLF